VGEVPTKDLEAAKVSGGISALDLFVHSGLAASKGQARKDLEGGGLYLNNVRLTEVGRMVGGADLLFGKWLLLRKGRRNYTVITVA
jgi:tyrosyl-tRNA synthetase